MNEEKFFEFIADYRIRQAEKILSNPEKINLIIEEVAEMVGYNSKSTFNAAFKKRTGLTPSQSIDRLSYSSSILPERVDVLPYRDIHSLWRKYFIIPFGTRLRKFLMEVETQMVRTRKFLVSIVISFIPVLIFAQTYKSRLYTARHIEKNLPPRIDGILNDKIWQTTEWETDFIQSVPYDSSSPSQQTSFKILFDKDMLYIAIRAHDTSQIELCVE